MRKLGVLLVLLIAVSCVACVDEIPSSPPSAPSAGEIPSSSPSAPISDEVPSSPPAAVNPEPQQAQPEQPQAEQPVAEEPDDPDRRASTYSYRDVRQFADDMLEVLAQERIWCDQQPAVAELRAMLDDHEAEDIWRTLLIPAAGEDLRAVDIIAEATAEARGIPLQNLPPVYLISRTSLRHYACLYEEVWEDPTAEQEDWTVGRPASRLAVLLGQEVEDYGDLEQSWLSATLFWGWYGEIEDAHELEPGEDGVGEVVIVSRPPMPASFVGVISHELVHFLQDQWTDWRLHDWYRDAETTDELEALRWVVEGDATLNELYGDTSPLLELLADVQWGPESNSEYDLWYRAFDALTPQDSVNLFAAYDQGSNVMAELRAKGGQEAIDALLLDPPESTEQLIHPEKLRSDEQPIALADLERLQAELFPDTDWNEPIVDRMGEQWLHTLILSTTRFSTLARSVSAGWGSDQMALWESQDGLAEVVTWQIVFDHVGHHREGVNGLRTWLYLHADEEALADPDDPFGLYRWDGPTGAVRLVIEPHALWLVAANDPTLADEVAGGILSRTWTNYWSSP